MFKIVTTIIFLFMATLFSQAAYAKLTCYELEDVVDTLDELADDLSNVRSIGINGEIDVALAELVEALNIIAVVENDRRLSSWIEDLEIAWEDMERDDFEESLDDIIDRLDDMGERDCDW